MNQLFFGDNLHILRKHIDDEYVDLIYLDPPFNSKRDYNLLFKTPKGQSSDAQITAFEDTWHWGIQAENEFRELQKQANTDVAQMMQALRGFLGANDLMAYLTMMANRLLELHRVLKSTGSLYLHCDPTAAHYLKVVLDSVFGKENFKNEISWKRSGRRSSISKSFRRAHDVILFYKKTDDYCFNLQYEEFDSTLTKKYTGLDARGQFRLVPLMASGKTRDGETGKPWRGFDPNTRGKAGMHWLTGHANLDAYADKGLVDFPRKIDGVPQLKYYLEDNKGVPLSDFWNDVDLINSMGHEALGYPTQKPLALLERIIQASSKEGDTILDPFCGCGTAVHAAQNLKRAWVGIDITHLAIGLIERRMKKAFPALAAKGAFEVEGVPTDFAGAADLALRDKYEFQLWALSLVGAQMFKGGKKGADGGIDGLIFPEVGKGKTEKIIVSVKGGENIGLTMLKDLITTVAHNGAIIGLFVTLAKPTKPMVTEAATAGHYESPLHGAFPRIQILTVEGLLNGTERARFPDMSAGANTIPSAKTEEKRGVQTSFLGPPQ